jgi:protein-S-isoprenylcysteine O-methyltransferase Ste14/glyoxylase-like metal-dependent hydrolase (beta-lactamase superfamily II)
MHWTQVVLAAALTLYVGAFIVIMVAVRRSTGANPRGHARGHGLAALVNGAAALLLVVIVIAYSVDAQSVDRFGRIALLDHPAARALGVVAVVLAGVCIVWGEVSLGRSFRVALPESVQPLVTHGIYRFTRNPLALSVDLLALGVLLLAPSRLALVNLVMNVASYECKIRIEEAYLRGAHSAAYVAYCARTGRYLPRLFRGREVGMTVWGVGRRFTILSVLYLMLALIAHYVWYPAFVIRGIPYVALVIVGLALVAIGVPIWVAASTAVDRAFAAGHLATQGVYALCRHPIYGNAIFFTIPGIMLFFRSWLLLTVPLAMVLVFRLLIREEEEYLREKFGPEFLAYERGVNAVFPRVWKLADAFFYPLPTGQVADHVYAVRDRHVNWFIYADGPHAVAIDAGYNGGTFQEDLGQLPIPPESVSHVFLTHADHDHAGRLELFKNAQVHLGRGEEQMIDGTTPRMLGVYHSPRVTHPYTVLSDGEVVSAGTIKVQAIATPGHTPGSTSFLVDDRVLFTGGTLALQNGLVRPFYRLLNMDTAIQRESIRKLARLENVALLCTAHTGCSADYAEAMGFWRDESDVER